MSKNSWVTVRLLNTVTQRINHDDGICISDSTHIDLADAEVEYDASSVAVVPNFISEQEHDLLVQECENSIRDLPYLEDHYDRVIRKYREVELSLSSGEWSLPATKVFDRVKKSAPLLPRDLPLSPQVHVIDIANDGHIEPHIDSIKFLGGFIIGMSLLSSSVMELTKTIDNASTTDKTVSTVRLLLPPRSLYVLGGVSRYQYKHAIVPSRQTWRDGLEVERARRISLIMRPHYMYQPVFSGIYGAL